MSVIKDRVGQEINEGDFVAYVTAGDRHPVIEFAYVLGFQQTKSEYSTKGLKIKLQRSEPNGTRKTVTAVDVPGHWGSNTPQTVLDYDNGRHYGSSRDSSIIMTHAEYWEARGEYWVDETYRDTGKPDTTMLEVSEKNTNGRLLIVKPYV